MPIVGPQRWREPSASVPSQSSELKGAAMRVFAIGGSVFGTVVIIVFIIGVLVALVVLARQRETFDREMGGLWIYHGTADTSPHDMPGTRFEERHVIDPPPSAEPADGLAAVASADTPATG
jgi:hypothetical protein